MVDKSNDLLSEYLSDLKKKYASEEVIKINISENDNVKRPAYWSKVAGEMIIIPPEILKKNKRNF